MEFDSVTNRAFVVTELDSKLVVYDVDVANGDLVEVETLPLYSPEFADDAGKSGEVQYPAEVALHPNGKWLYVTNRGLGAIFLFDVSGTLALSKYILKRQQCIITRIVAQRYCARHAIELPRFISHYCSYSSMSDSMHGLS